MDQYRANPYGSYFGTPKLRFPVRPAPPAGGPAPKTPVVAVRTGETWSVFSIPRLALDAGASGGDRGSTLIDGVLVSLHARGDPPTVRVTADPPCDVVYSLWFAWHAFHSTDSRPVE